MASTRDVIKYGYAFGKLSVMRAHAITPGIYELLIDAGNIEDQIKILSDSQYGSKLRGAQSSAEISAGLDAALEDSYRWLERAQVSENLSQFFRAPYDFANLSVLAKRKALDLPLEDAELQSFGTLDAEALKERLEELLSDPEIAGMSIEELEAYLSRESIFSQLAFAQKSRIPYLRDLIGLRIETTNIKLALRVRSFMQKQSVMGLKEALALIKEQALPGGAIDVEKLARAIFEVEDEELSAALKPFIPKHTAYSALNLEQLKDSRSIDAALLRVEQAHIDAAQKLSAGPEVVIAHIARSEIEVRLIRAILLATIAKLPKEELVRSIVAPKLTRGSR